MSYGKLALLIKLTFMASSEQHDSKLDTVIEKDWSIVYFTCQEMSTCIFSSNFRLEKEKQKEKGKDVNTAIIVPCNHL